MDKFTTIIIIFFIICNVLTYISCFYYLYKNDKLNNSKIEFLKNKIIKLKKLIKKKNKYHN